MRRAMEQTLKALREHATTHTYFTQSVVRGFLRASGKGQVAVFVLIALEKEGFVERVSQEVPFEAALWRVKEVQA